MAVEQQQPKRRTQDDKRNQQKCRNRKKKEIITAKRRENERSGMHRCFSLADNRLATNRCGLRNTGGLTRKKKEGEWRIHREHAAASHINDDTHMHKKRERKQFSATISSATSTNST